MKMGSLNHLKGSRIGRNVANYIRSSIRCLATEANDPSIHLARVPMSNLEADAHLPYPHLQAQLTALRRRIPRPLTLSEKILYTHLSSLHTQDLERGKSFLKLYPDRVACHDANATMAMLQFISAGLDRVALPTTIHCDHLTMAERGAEADLAAAKIKHQEVFEFLASAAKKYGIGFWKPGAGIIHTVIFENYAFPGGLLVGTDSHTPNAAGMAMLGIGVGGSDAVDAMAGEEWELPCPKVLGVRVTGRLNGWASAKDIICTLAGITSVSGGKGHIVEFFGPGTESLSATAMATVGNMSAEIGATSCVFPYPPSMGRYLDATNRSAIRRAAEENLNLIQADEGCEAYYDDVIEIDLDQLEPRVNGPFTPDLSHPISKLQKAVEVNEWPQELSASLVGSCTNSSYEDLMKVKAVAEDALQAGLQAKIPFYISPGSEQIRATAERDGILNALRQAGATVLSSSCGPCVGQWNRQDVPKGQANSIISSFNRNFVGRQDGNTRTHSFVTSPEVATAFAFSGSLGFNPVSDGLMTANGEEFYFTPPHADELPQEFSFGQNVYQAPVVVGSDVEVKISPNSDRLQLLTPFEPWTQENATDLPILLKVKGKCTTDHISPAGPWYDYRGHLENISRNLLTGAENAFLPASSPRGLAQHILTGAIQPIPEIARSYKASGIKWCLIAGHNYGEGSSREHAALEPRFLNGTVIIAHSFARIHETNLKKQGMLPLTFEDGEAYERFERGDRVSVLGLEEMEEGVPLRLVVKRRDGGCWEAGVRHSFHAGQMGWLREGSALNWVRKRKSGGQ